METAETLRLHVTHSESGEAPQGVQVGIPVISLVDHAVLLVPPSVLSQETLQVPAVVIVANDQVGVLVRWPGAR